MTVRAAEPRAHFPNFNLQRLKALYFQGEPAKLEPRPRKMSLIYVAIVLYGNYGQLNGILSTSKHLRFIFGGKDLYVINIDGPVENRYYR